jgi:hypothetical protein
MQGVRLNPTQWAVRPTGQLGNEGGGAWYCYGWWGHHHTGYTRDFVFYELQVVSNMIFTSGSDSADHSERKRWYLLHTMSKRGVVWSFAKKTMKAFFWFWSELQNFCGSFCVTPTRCCVTYFGSSRPCIVLDVSPGWGRNRLVALNPSTPPFGINTIAATTLGFGFCLVLFFSEKQTSSL